jgi:hypothetical protein
MAAHNYVPLYTGFRKVASVTNFALQNATPNILTYTTPNDGQYHIITIVGLLIVNTVEAGGQINFSVGGNPGILFASNKAVGTYNIPDTINMMLAGPNASVLVSQATALTSGAANIDLEVWMN